MEQFQSNPIQSNKREVLPGMENIESELSKTQTAIENGELKPEKKKKLERVLRKFLRMTRNIAFAGSVLAVANHERTHDDLNVETVGSEKVYTHPDAQTTHILNVLAGKESMTEGDLLIQIRNILAHKADEKGVKFDKSPNEMSIDELDAAFTSLGGGNKPGEMKAGLEAQMAHVQEKSEYLRAEGKEKEIYELIWKMEEECGNPRIRFAAEAIGFTPFKSFEGNSHYDPVNNVVYMSINRLWENMTSHQDSFFGEMAHAKQFNDDQISSYLNQISDFVRVFKAGGFDMNKLSESYHDLYATPGAVEHEAHAVLEPYLRDKYGKYFISYKDYRDMKDKKQESNEE